MKDETDKTDHLWFLEYDIDAYFKSFLNVPFRKFLSNILSNQHFNYFQEQMAKELEDPLLWKERQWVVLKLFAFLNDQFGIEELDKVVAYIEEDKHQKTLGHFKLWIDLQRLYLMCFSRLDQQKFQDNRIYLSLYRVMKFVNSFFSEYDESDFNREWILKFIHQAMENMINVYKQLPKEMRPLVTHIFKIFENFQQKRYPLLDKEQSNEVQKQAYRRIVQSFETINEVQERLSTILKQKYRNKRRGWLRNMVEHDELKLLFHQTKKQYFKELPKFVQQDEPLKDERAKNALRQNLHYAYTDINYYLYGHALKINMEVKQDAHKQETNFYRAKQIEDINQDKYYFGSEFDEKLKSPDLEECGSVRDKDLARINQNLSRRSGDYKADSAGDDDGKVFNFKWQQGEYCQKRDKGSKKIVAFGKGFQNNILFKAPLEDIEAQKKNQLNRRRDENKPTSATIMNMKRMEEELFPENYKHSFGKVKFVDKEPFMWNMKTMESVQRNKFDFFRKTILYTATEQKLLRLQAERVILDSCRRTLEDICQIPLNGFVKKRKIALAKEIAKYQ